MQNIHDHQYEFMKNFEEQNGISFLIIYYSHIDESYYLPFAKLDEFYKRSKNGGRKSFRFEEIDKEYKIRSYKGVPIHFLEPLQKDLSGRENNS